MRLTNFRAAEGPWQKRRLRDRRIGRFALNRLRELLRWRRYFRRFPAIGSLSSMAAKTSGLSSSFSGFNSWSRTFQSCLFSSSVSFGSSSRISLMLIALAEVMEFADRSPVEKLQPCLHPQIRRCSRFRSDPKAQKPQRLSSADPRI